MDGYAAELSRRLQLPRNGRALARDWLSIDFAASGCGGTVSIRAEPPWASRASECVSLGAAGIAVLAGFASAIIGTIQSGRPSTSILSGFVLGGVAGAAAAVFGFAARKATVAIASRRKRKEEQAAAAFVREAWEELRARDGRLAELTEQKSPIPLAAAWTVGLGLAALLCWRLSLWSVDAGHAIGGIVSLSGAWILAFATLIAAILFVIAIVL
ncbi:MAG: hypothetical protein HY554_03370 [Elusimicrobia bacterium]|nr:hypothetical protein [Elusimicrobiota bacterium]